MTIELKGDAPFAQRQLVLLAPMSLAVLSMAVWFLAKGADSAKWEASRERRLRR